MNTVTVMFEAVSELIDTQWDVNDLMKILTACHTGINRYIVGCKYRQCRCPHQNIRELIDTQWDVNVNKDSDSQGKIVELIDTQWDVNLFSVFHMFNLAHELIDTQWDVNTF